jgi:hypothetical protein
VKKLLIPIYWELKFSKRLLKFAILMYGLAIFAVHLSDIQLIYQLGLSLIILIEGYYRYYHYQLSATAKIRFDPNVKNWQLAINFTADYSPIHILPSTVLTTQLILLHYRLHSNRKQTLIIVKDSLTRSQYRLLLTMLKINAIKMV